MRSLIFEGKTWLEYEKLRERDARAHKKLRTILKEMLRHDPAAGIGKPEQLKHDLSGFWSRRISHAERVVYRFDDDAVYIFAIGGHYD